MMKNRFVFLLCALLLSSLLITPFYAFADETAAEEQTSENGGSVPSEPSEPSEPETPDHPGTDDPIEPDYDENSFNVTVPYGETSITFCVTFDNGGELAEAQGLGDSYTEGVMNGPWFLGQPFFLTGYYNYGTENVSVIEESVYAMLSDVTVEIEDQASGLSAEVYTASPEETAIVSDAFGYPAHAFHLLQESPAPFETNTVVTFRFNELTCRFSVGIFYQEDNGEGGEGHGDSPELQPSVREYTEILYNGEQITVTISNFQDGGFRSVSRMGDNFKTGDTSGILPWYSTSNLYIMAFENYRDQENEKPAATELVNAIIVDEVKIDFNGPMTQIGPVSVSNVLRYNDFAGHSGYEVNGFRLNMEYGKPFKAYLIVTFHFDGNIADLVLPHAEEGTVIGYLGDGQYQLKTYVFYEQDPNAYVTADDLTTAAELNSVLAGKDSLARYLEKRNISFSFSGGTVDMTLPSVDYDDIIICDVGEMNQGASWSLRLKGNETSMPGLVFRSGLGFVENIRFTGTVAQSSGDTIGIWCSGNSAMDWVRCSNNHIQNCSFEGLDYGVLTSPTAYCGSITDCSFENCRNGIVLDNKNMAQAAPNCAISYNTFRDNDTAISVLGLPGNITNYMFRVHHNRFLNSGIDIRSDIPGDQFFYLNYYGDDSGRRTANVQENNGAVLAINPCMKSENFQEETYWISPGRNGKNRILRSEAPDLLIDPDSLPGNEIAIITEADTAPIAVFNFRGEAA